MKLKSLKKQGLHPVIEIVTCADENEAFRLEAKVIDAFGRRQDGGWLFNIALGGAATKGFEGRKHTAEAKERIRVAMRNRKLSVEHRVKIGAANKGRPGPSDETQRKAIEARRTPEVRAKFSAAAKRNVSHEHLCRMSALAKAKRDARDS